MGHSCLTLSDDSWGNRQKGKNILKFCLRFYRGGVDYRGVRPMGLNGYLSSNTVPAVTELCR